jgi:hypothetical protein
VLDSLLEIKAPCNPASAAEQVAALLKSYRLRETTGDCYAAGFAINAFAAHGVKLRHANRDRSGFYLETLPLFTSGRIRLLDSKRLVTQLASFERRTMPGGKDRVDHPIGGSDELANACAGTVTLAISRPQPVMAGPIVITSGNVRFDGIGGPTGPWERLMIEERRNAERQRVDAERLRRMWSG